jgi:hypothetical protein
MRRCHLKRPLTSQLFQGHQKQQTDTINRKLFENASSPVFAFSSKIIRFYFIGVFPDFLDTLYIYQQYILLFINNISFYLSRAFHTGNDLFYHTPCGNLSNNF